MRVLVTVAHPDDECLLAGGAIARHAAAGDEVLCSYATDGVSARGEGNVHNQRKRRRQEFLAAVAVLGAQADGSPVTMFDYDQRLDQVGVLDLAQAQERLLEQWRPEVVYTHHPADLNQDHKAVALAVLIATRPYAAGRGVRAVYAGEIPGHPLPEAQGGGRRYVVLGQDAVERKVKAFRCYKSEEREHPHPRSWQAVKGLATTRGVECGWEFAEAFAVLWEVWAP